MYFTVLELILATLPLFNFEAIERPILLTLLCSCLDILNIGICCFNSPLVV